MLFLSKAAFAMKFCDSELYFLSEYVHLRACVSALDHTIQHRAMHGTNVSYNKMTMIMVLLTPSAAVISSSCSASFTDIYYM